MSKIKRFIAAIAALAMVAAVFTGCGEKKKSAKIDTSAFFDFNEYKDSEDIPDWTGEKLKLIKWVDVNSTNAYINKTTSKDDVVSPEIERITGVSFDAENSFDNSGGSFDAKVTQMIAAEEYPHIANSIPDLSGLIKKGVLWRLDELIEKYAPTVYKYVGPDTAVFGAEWKRQMDQYGGVYAIPMGKEHASVRAMVEEDKSYDLTPEQVSWMAGPGYSPYPYVYVREDVLKMLYPEAKTSAELDAIFKKNGKFTLEEMLDVPLDTPQDFVDMLYNIKDLNLKDDDGNEVYPIFTHNGSDNWGVLTQLGSMFQYYLSTGANYFSYYDLEEQKMKYTFKEDWFKDILKMWNKMINDGVASKEALLDTNQLFNEKLNSGRYIVCYGSYIPNEQSLNGKYKYRRVYARYKVNTDKFLNVGTNQVQTGKYSFFTTLDENQIIQALRCLEFTFSDPGQKLINWGTKSAGLYTEDENGVLQYKDEKLKNQMLQPKVYGTDLLEKYGLDGYVWPKYFLIQDSKFAPEAFYNPISTWEQAFNPAYIESVKLKEGNSADIYATAVTAAIPEASTFWSSRNGFEEALLKCFAAKNSSEFESRYKEAVKYAERNGLTEETLKKYEKFYKEDYNKAYMHYLK